MPRAIYISLCFTIILYVALSVGVFGTLTVEEVIANADTALAVAALPIFGQAGFTLISVAALFATTGSLNSQLYANTGLTGRMAEDGTLPPVFGRKMERGGTYGLVIASVITLIVTNLFNLATIASLGSAVALSIYVLITIAHLRLADETKASKPVLILALLTASLAILLFAWYTLETDPQFFVVFLASIVLAWVVEAILRRTSKREPGASENPGT
jgi:amino acid transporter